MQTRPRKERKENADRRRRQLLDATRRSIVSNGLRRTTLATVAAEAGLSPGVAVFYFKSKSGLLAEALRDLYDSYERNWTRVLDAAGENPLAQLISLIYAEFDPLVCTEEFISVWFAFWGDKEIMLPQTGRELSAFDQRIEQVGLSILKQLLPGEPERAKEISAWLEALLAGYWLLLHQDPNINVADAREGVLRFVATQLPEHSDAILNELALMDQAEG